MALTPTFDEDVTEYTADTSNATNKITATPKDESYTVTILNGETEIENGASATWAEGENTVTVTVSDGENDNVYTVTVTCTPPAPQPTPPTLTSLAIGELTLTPTFDADTTTYTATATNASDTITATAEQGATISILNGKTPIENGGTATWVDGTNTVTVTVEKDDLSTDYTVTITYTE